MKWILIFMVFIHCASGSVLIHYNVENIQLKELNLNREITSSDNSYIARYVKKINMMGTLVSCLRVSYAKKTINVNIYENLVYNWCWANKTHTLLLSQHLARSVVLNMVIFDRNKYKYIAMDPPFNLRAYQIYKVTQNKNTIKIIYGITFPYYESNLLSFNFLTFDADLKTGVKSNFKISKSFDPDDEKSYKPISRYKLIKKQLTSHRKNCAK